MQVKLLAFATAATKLGWREMILECSHEDTPRKIFQSLSPSFDLDFARVALNCEYHAWDTPIGAGAKELAIIPPVSGG